MIVYKVLYKNEDGQLLSVIEAYDCPGGLRYLPNQRTYPSVGRIFAFRTLSAAQDWRRGDPVWEIWKAEGENPRARRAMVSLGAHKRSKLKREFRRFWKAGGRKSRYTRPTLSDTVTCSSIQLLELVE